MIGDKLSQDSLNRFSQSLHAPNDSYLFIDDRFGPLLIRQGTLPWQPIKVEKIGVFYRPIYFVVLPFGNGL